MRIGKVLSEVPVEPQAQESTEDADVDVPEETETVLEELFQNLQDKVRVF